MTPATPRAGSPQVQAEYFRNLLEGWMLRPMKPITSVYPLYIISRIRKSLRGADTENLLREMGEIQTVGDCVHTLSVTDFNGTEYTITVEVSRYSENGAGE